ncbi:MAG: hypothetical protein H6737_31225 [Alphaproteobacteria bacterium]|nr:hypothetical protein [Alphaproteobacteria bacterium]
MLLALLSFTAFAAPPERCDEAFFSRVFPDGMPHRPPPLRPLLEFAWDANDDGTLDDSERARLDRDVALRCDALESIADALDADGDGTITPTERHEGLQALFGPPPPPPPSRPPEDRLPPPLIRAFDADHDRTLSAAERRVARDEVRDRFRNGLPPIPPPER